MPLQPIGADLGKEREGRRGGESEINREEERGEKRGRGGEERTEE